MISNMGGAQNLAKDLILRRILFGEAKLVLLGQAKRISPTEQVEPRLIRELRGAIALIGGRRVSIEHPSPVSTILKELNATPGDPLLGVFITSGWFSKEARLVAGQSRIEIIDGEQLAQILLREGIGCRLVKGQKPQFNIQALRAWIQSEK
jgi:restriction endonuclease Mrr